MPTRIYATPADLAEWTGGDAPANAAALLRFASTLVEGATTNAVYATDDTGKPTRADVLGAFESATCAQAAFWASNDIDPTGGALGELAKGHATSKSIKGASVGYSVTLVEANNQARTAAVNSLGDEAWHILRNAGLITGAVQ